MRKTEDIRIRDPFVVAHGRMYYLYGAGRHEWGDFDENAIYVFRSTDLENWEEPTPVFFLPRAEEFWGCADLWAPEVHLYNGKFYLFVSILGKPGFGTPQDAVGAVSEEELAFRHLIRGTQIAVCDTPDGEFRPVANRPGTPVGPSCIDGTLYAEDGRPYHIYSHDWPHNFRDDIDCYDGEIMAVEMTPDLTENVGEPFLLFRSSEAGRQPCEHICPEGTVRYRYGSDAPFLSKMANGSLLLTWSPIPEGNYLVVAAVSKSGSIRGPWEHLEMPIFDKNGGHAMFFNTFDGRRMMCIHCPECPPYERATFLEVEEDGDTYKIKK